MRINIDLIKESDIAHAIRLDDIDEACLYLQTIAGITDGGIASICMSDTTFDWERDVERREDMVRSWLDTERTYAANDLVEEMAAALVGAEEDIAPQIAAAADAYADVLDELARNDGACLYWQMTNPARAMDAVRAGCCAMDDDLVVHPASTMIEQGMAYTMRKEV